MGVTCYDCPRCNAEFSNCGDHFTCEGCGRVYCGECEAKLRQLIAQHKRDYYIDAAGEERTGKLEVWMEESGALVELDPRVPDELERIHAQYQDTDYDRGSEILRCFACSDVDAIRSLYEGDELLKHLLKLANTTLQDAKRDMRVHCSSRLRRKTRGMPPEVSMLEKKALKRAHSDTEAVQQPSVEPRKRQCSLITLDAADDDE